MSKKTLLPAATILSIALNSITQFSFAQSLTSTTLPIIVIDTDGQAILDEPKINAHMGIISHLDGRLNNVADTFDAYSGQIAIETRGSTSQELFPKKPYGFELRRSNGTDLDTALLGMPSEEDWILFAPYNDKTLMRDVLAYKLARDQGRYASRTRFCELIINGEYQGVHVLMEKIKRGKNRVDVNKLDTDENSGDALTGGYILKIDKFTGASNDSWVSSFPAGGPTFGQIFFLYHYPDPSKITVDQKNYIQHFMQEFESALKGDNFDDPINGYAKYIDVDSFVDFMIMQEITKNVDGYRLSTYFYKQRNSDGGKLVMGPVWDFNLGFGNADYCTRGNPEGLVLDFNEICGGDFFQIPFWWYRLLEDKNFRSRLANRWAELRAGKFATATIRHYIDSVAQAIDLPQKRNFEKWPVLGTYVWPNYFVGPTYQSEIDWLKTWVSKRTEWLDTEFGKYLSTPIEAPVDTEITNVEYENPFINSLSIRYKVGVPGEVSCQLYNDMGALIESVSDTHVAPGDHTQIMAARLVPGFYFCRIKFNGRTLRSLKVIKR